MAVRVARNGKRSGGTAKGMPDDWKLSKARAKSIFGSWPADRIAHLMEILAGLLVGKATK